MNNLSLFNDGLNKLKAAIDKMMDAYDFVCEYGRENQDWTAIDKKQNDLEKYKKELNERFRI